MSELMEVRCCCNPKKLMGWLPVDRIGARVDYHIIEQGFSWRDVSLEGALFSEPKITIVSLPVQTFIDPESGNPPKLALKSEETPIETLRKIRGFIEAK